MPANNVYNPLQQFIGGYGIRDLQTGDLVFYPVVPPAASYEFLFTGSPDDLPNATYWILAENGGLAWAAAGVETAVIQLVGGAILVGDQNKPLILNSPTVEDSDTNVIIDGVNGLFGSGNYTLFGANLKVLGNQVVGAQQAAVADAAATLVSLQAQLNSLLAKLRTHGLIAT